MCTCSLSNNKNISKNNRQVIELENQNNTDTMSQITARNTKVAYSYSSSSLFDNAYNIKDKTNKNIIEATSYDDMVSLLSIIKDFNAYRSKKIPTKINKVIKKTIKILLSFIHLLTAGVSIHYKRYLKKEL